MNPAQWAWVILAAIIAVYVTVFDVWAHYASRQSMSGAFHDWLGGPVTGPLIVGIWAGVFIALTYHFAVTRGH